MINACCQKTYIYYTYLEKIIFDKRRGKKLNSPKIAPLAIQTSFTLRKFQFLFLRTFLIIKLLLKLFSNTLKCSKNAGKLCSITKYKKVSWFHWVNSKMWNFFMGFIQNIFQKNCTFFQIFLRTLWSTTSSLTWLNSNQIIDKK